jgi:hypothetical protein
MMLFEKFGQHQPLNRQAVRCAPACNFDPCLGVIGAQF